MKITYYKKILICNFALCLLLISCANKDRYVISDSRVVKYRSPIDPVGHLAGNFAKNPTAPSYRQFFLSWFAEHRNLENSLGKSVLAVVDAHHNIQNALSNMHTFLDENKKQKLQAYQKLYDTLLLALRRNTSLRILTTRYRALGKSINEEFSPTATN
ncbi:hypothetical protein [Candidatus Uabimicrobium amorphum]|uniref:Uncharacterized protein n=1 Tax=Uabimicrobium amorphum TaxID=2596890 RepID=A0A5S9F1X5_UABAM|nr:hypothetical protein [Candidatus Uabimicrobium amorphum]BBM81784.1 hypothetical protein UABAM_00123 [Candidatus Uabimicrobium amorphum]